MSLVAKPKDILRNVVVATAGDLGKPGFDDGGVQRYVKAWGGRFSADLDESVTHLLVSKHETKAKKSHPRVCQGQKRRKLQIVTVDWLEDSINKKKKQPAKPYSLVRMRKEANAAKKRELDKNKNIEKAGHFLNPAKYRVYTDSTFFRYEVSLTKDRDAGRWMLTLFESVAEPRLYHAVVKYWHSAASSNGGKPTKRPRPRKTSEQLLHETPGPFAREFAVFKKFFRQRTGVPWDRRLAVFAKGKGKPISGRYIYEPPTGGKPVGLVAGHNPYADDDDDADDEEDGDENGDDNSSHTIRAGSPDGARDDGGHASPGGGGGDEDEDAEAKKEKPDEDDDDIDAAVRGVLGPAVATNARAGEAIDACVAALMAYEVRPAEDRVADVVTA